MIDFSYPVMPLETPRATALAISKNLRAKLPEGWRGFVHASVDPNALLRIHVPDQPQISSFCVSSAHRASPHGVMFYFAGSAKSVIDAFEEFAQHILRSEQCKFVIGSNLPPRRSVAARQSHIARALAIPTEGHDQSEDSGPPPLARHIPPPRCDRIDAAPQREDEASWAVREACGCAVRVLIVSAPAGPFRRRACALLDEMYGARDACDVVRIGDALATLFGSAGLVEQFKSIRDATVALREKLFAETGKRNAAAWKAWLNSRGFAEVKVGPSRNALATNADDGDEEDWRPLFLRERSLTEDEIAADARTFLNRWGREVFALPHSTLLVDETDDESTLLDWFRADDEPVQPTKITPAFLAARHRGNADAWTMAR